MSDKSSDSQNSSLETRVSVIETKVDMFIQEMRDRDNQRAAENLALRTEMNAKIASIESKLDDMGKHVRNVSIATIAVCIASVVGTVTMALSIILK